jgi:hypothetical protein
VKGAGGFSAGKPNLRVHMWWWVDVCGCMWSCVVVCGCAATRGEASASRGVVRTRARAVGNAHTRKRRLCCCCWCCCCCCRRRAQQSTCRPRMPPPTARAGPHQYVNAKCFRSP